MTDPASLIDIPETIAHPMKSQFLRWQCRVRQKAMRGRSGKPDDAVMPQVTLPGDDAPMGRIITVLSKQRPFSKTPELMHIAKRTEDPAQRLEKALQLFSEMYYQKADEFSDGLTATFNPGSEGARAIETAGGCFLNFEAYNQQFRLKCSSRRLPPDHWLYQATWWHNYQFNPNLHPDTIVLVFRPDWDRCEAGSGLETN